MLEKKIFSRKVTFWEEREYGFLFYSEDNKDSYDSKRVAINAGYKPVWVEMKAMKSLIVHGCSPESEKQSGGTLHGYGLYGRRLCT